MVALKLMTHLEFPRDTTLAGMGALTGSSFVITVTPQWKIYSVCLLGDSDIRRNIKIFPQGYQSYVVVCKSCWQMLLPPHGKTRDLFKKIRDTKGTFHANMGTIKDRNCMDLTEAEDIKKTWQEYTELYQKDLHDPDNHDGVITHLEPDILEYEVGLRKHHYEQS